MRVNQTHSSMLISPMRTIVGKVEHYKGSTLLNTFKHTDALSNFKVSRTAAKKFFGFGVAQEVELKLVDKNRAITVNEGDMLDVIFEVDSVAFYPYPYFFVSKVTRDENTNQLTIKAGDNILTNASKSIDEVKLTPPYTIRALAEACAEAIGCESVRWVNAGTSYNATIDALNVESADSIRSVLDDIAEATQTIYYQDADEIIFKRLDVNGNAALTVSKSDYFTLSAKTPCVLNAVASVTELGDNVIASRNNNEYTQYIRDNAIWTLRNDIVTQLDNALAAVGGLTIYPFNCKWRGNYLLEIGDKINLVTKNNDTITAYLLEEQTTYNGGLNSTMSWEYEKDNGGFNNPSTLGEAVYETYAKVDKVNKQIDLVVSESSKNSEEVAAMKEQVSQISMTTESVSTTVSSLEQQVGNNQDDIISIKKEVEMMVTDEDLTIAISSELANGVNQVTTATGYTFNADGLTIERSDSEITTTITQDGMSIKRGDDLVLTANNEGVSAEDLHATTYLIIGENSRFEDYKDGNKKRTGCFWIGG